jgi:hypothetical protein
MKWKSGDLRIYLNLVSVTVLLIGLGTAIFIYHSADSASSGALGYQIIGGTVYPIMPENTKIYRHDLEVYGGKAAVLADQFRRWFIGLWQGKTLAYTIACLTILFSFAGFIAARQFPPRGESDIGGKDKRDSVDQE